jgi:IPT/TIG domain
MAPEERSGDRAANGSEPERGPAEVGSRLGAVERRLRTLTRLLVVVAILALGLGVVGVVELRSYTPVVHLVLPRNLAGVGVHGATTSGGAGTAGSTGSHGTANAGGSGPPIVIGVHPAAGPSAGGGAVDVVGANLSSATLVYFGDVAATTFTVRAAGTSLVATAPPHIAGVVDVTVVTPVGTSAVNVEDQYSYRGPAMLGLAPRSGPAGTTVVISGTNLLGTTLVTFGGDAASIVSVNPSGTRITALVPPGAAGAVDVLVTTPGGTSAPSAASRFTAG